MIPRQQSAHFHCECEYQRALQRQRAEKHRAEQAAYAARRIVELQAARAMFVERVG